ncbi:hypothetical protein ACFL02_03810 [Planctomycetota bacterium]
MEITDKQLIKIADLILSKLILLRNNRYDEIQKQLYNVNANYEKLQAIREGIFKCLCFKWHRTAEKLATKTQRIMQELPYALGELERTIKTSEAELPSLRQVYEELKQIQEEFGQLTYNPQEKILSVFTEPIELEEIFLGDFEIQLQIPQIGNSQGGSALRIIALDVHPAASSDVVTHPHVSDEYLCAGDASVPMQKALLDGRICDYFMLVKSVLETYNPSSPYVALDQWEGYPCYDCGYITDEENSFYCESCDQTYCDECFGYCRCCDTSICRSCLTSCPVCEESTCESCMQTCSECNELVCSSCIKDNLCPSCKEESEAQDEEPVETEEPVRTKPKVA